MYTVSANMEMYFAGEEPNLAKSPRIDAWQAVFVDGAMRVEGTIDGAGFIRTADVVWMDRDLRWCQTAKGGLYVLGEMEREMPMEITLDDAEGS